MGTVEFLASLLLVAGLVGLGWSRLFDGVRRPAGLAPVAKPFMTRREQAALVALEQVLPMYRIHAQVAMGALLKVPSVPGRRVTSADWHRFARKIVDFVIEDPTTGKVVALVEIDDGSHDVAKDRERDTMTARAGYRTLRIPAGAKPTIPVVARVVGHLRHDAATVVSG